jgi:hypothetical protein
METDRRASYACAAAEVNDRWTRQMDEIFCSTKTGYGALNPIRPGV